jgi:hypothetical protein
MATMVFLSACTAWVGAPLRSAPTAIIAGRFGRLFVMLGN